MAAKCGGGGATLSVGRTIDRQGGNRSTPRHRFARRRVSYTQRLRSRGAASDGKRCRLNHKPPALSEPSVRRPSRCRAAGAPHTWVRAAPFASPRVPPESRRGARLACGAHTSNTDSGEPVRAIPKGRGAPPPRRRRARAPEKASLRAQVAARQNAAAEHKRPESRGRGARAAGAGVPGAHARPRSARRNEGGAPLRPRKQPRRAARTPRRARHPFHEPRVPVAGALSVW